MKELIVLMAVLLILMVFPLQYATEQKNHHNLSVLYSLVNASKEEARQDGYFTTTNITNLKTQISSKFKDVTEAEITITATTLADRKVRGELIYYRVEVPIKKILAAATFWGIDPADNQMNFVIEAYAASEWVSP